MLLLLPLIATLTAASRIAERDVQPIHERQLNSSGDPCGRLVGLSPAFVPRTILACMQSIAFKPAVRTNIMGVANTMYTQLDILAYNQLGDSEASVNQSVNIQTEFQRINSTSYSSDFDFQFDLSRAMTLLNDGHHAWSSCYRSLFSTTHGIPIVSLGTSGENTTTPDIYIVPDVVRFVSGYGFTTYYAQAGLDVASLAGAQVLRIEGKAAWDYIVEDKLPVTGVYLDKQQRLNSVFASYSGEGGLWSRIPGRFTSTRDWTRDNMTMTVKTTAGVTKDISIPWVVRFAGTAAWNYTTGENFWNAQCGTARSIRISETATQANTTGTANGSTVAPTEADLAAFARSAYRSCPITANAPGISVVASEDPTRSSAYLGGRDVMFFRLPNTTTGVVHLSTFSPDPETNSCINRFFIDLVFGLRNFTAAGIQNILIDTSNNPGGFIVLSQVAQVLFTGQKFENEANFETVLRRSPLSEALLQRFIDTPSLAGLSSTFNPATYRSGSSQLARNANYFSPGREYSINKQTLRTSNLLRDSVRQIDLLDMVFNINDTASFAPQNIVITGNGLCGSACSTFVNFLIEYYNGTGIIQAAQPANPIEYTAFMAGQAFTTTALYQDAVNMGFNSTLLPRLNHAGSFGFAVRAALSPILAPGEFLQYRSAPAASRFALTKDRYSDQLASWTYIASRAFPRAGNFTGAGGTGTGTNTGTTGTTPRSAGRAVTGSIGIMGLLAIVGMASCLIVYL